MDAAANSSPPASRLDYRADIDALRAIAVLAVVAFHLDHTVLPGGYLGVDIFFVISGYLITRLLLNDYQQGRRNFALFWRRRILRILPALLAMVLITFVAGHLFLYGPDRYLLAVNGAAALVSFGNISHWRNYGGYWGADAKDSPFLHTWSLGVEEQFYLLYPLMLWLVWRAFAGRAWIAMAAMFVVSAVLYSHMQFAHPSAAFYLLPTRAWELLAGGLAATANMRGVPSLRTGKVMAFGGLILILAAYFWAPAEGPGWWILASVAGATMVVGSASMAAFDRLGLTSRGVVFVGLVSYSLYLWHWPVIVIGRAVAERSGIAAPTSMLFCLSMAAAWASWRCIERPTRHARVRWAVGSIVMLVLALSVLLFALRSMNGTEDTAVLGSTEWDGQAFNVSRPPTAWAAAVVRRVEGIKVAPWHGDAGAYRDSGVSRSYSKHSSLDILVLGDSHGLMWSPVIDAVARDQGLSVVFQTADGTPVFFDVEHPDAAHGGLFFDKMEMIAFNRARLQLIRKRQPRVAVIASRWRDVAAEEGAGLVSLFVESGIKVVLIDDPPEFRIGDRNAPQYLAYLGLLPGPGATDAWTDRIHHEALAESSRAVRALAARCPESCSVVDVKDLYLRQSGSGPMLQVIKQSKPLLHRRRSPKRGWRHGGARAHRASDLECAWRGPSRGCIAVNPVVRIAPALFVQPTMVHAHSVPLRRSRRQRRMICRCSHWTARHGVPNARVRMAPQPIDRLLDGARRISCSSLRDWRAYQVHRWPCDRQ